MSRATQKACPSGRLGSKQGFTSIMSASSILHNIFTFANFNGGAECLLIGSAKARAERNSCPASYTIPLCMVIIAPLGQY